MITERLQLLSDELNTEFTFSVDDYGNMVDLKISETKQGICLPRFAILVDDGSLDERYVLSVLELSQTVYFGSDICETIKVFVSPNIEEIFRVIKEEVLNSASGGMHVENGDSKESEG
jgi:hypothetical protein